MNKLLSSAPRLATSIQSVSAGIGLKPIKRKILMLGKTGVGKSSTGNTIFGENIFAAACSSNSVTRKYEAHTGLVHGREITLADTPGFFDTDVSEEELKPEIVKIVQDCATEDAPGLHAFLIVLKVERFTTQEKESNKILQCFSEKALKHATILFTHGRQLKGRSIEEFVNENKSLRDLVQRCGGRNHVIDNEFWNNDGKVKELLETIDMGVEENGSYSNELIQTVRQMTLTEKRHIKETSAEERSEEEITRIANDNVHEKLWNVFSAVTTDALLGALLGVRLLIEELKDRKEVLNMLCAAGAGLGTAAVEPSLRIGVGTAVAAAALGGAIAGGIIGLDAAKGSETVREAMEKSARAVWESSEDVLAKAKQRNKPD